MYTKHRSFLVTAGTAFFGLSVMASTAYGAVPAVSSAKITGPQTVTVVYSEPVTTSQTDYGNFSGALGGRNLTGISGSGSNTITLTFDGVALGADANGNLAIASTTASVSDHSSFGGGSIAVSDGQIPLLTSFGVSSGGSMSPLAKMGGSIMLTFNVNEAIASPAVTILGHAIGAIGGSTGPYTVNYVMSSGDQEGVVPVTIDMADLAGNAGKVRLSLTNANGVIPAPIPVPVATPPAPLPAPVPVAIPVPAPAATENKDAQYQALIKELAQKKAQLEQETATPPVSAPVKFARALSVGSVGDDVAELQQRLTNEGLYHGAITGRFGALTRDAVKAYQKKHRLAPLGTVGPGTRTLLNR